MKPLTPRNLRANLMARYVEKQGRPEPLRPLPITHDDTRLLRAALAYAAFLAFGALAMWAALHP